MKKTLVAVAISAATILGASADTLIQFDFAGALATAASNTATSTFEIAGIADSTMTRGSTISANNAANSFRGTGFSNDGISLSNTDYFQFNVTANVGSLVTVQSIYGNFNGTSTFTNSPGVTIAYAYSLDGGSTFTLMSSFTRVGAGTSTYTVTGADLTALTNISSVVFRMYASGQTPTGGFGLQSAASAGTIGLQVDGLVTAAVPEPHEYAVAIASLLGVVVMGRRRRSMMNS